MTSRLHTLLYHRIQRRHASHVDLAPDLISATPEVFERHLSYLARHCAPVSVAEVLAALDERHHLPKRAVLVTFDDGYRDFADCAWPLLKQFRIPCVLFVSTAFAQDPSRVFWWDALWQLLTRTREPIVVLDARHSLPLATHEQCARAYLVLSEWLKVQTAAARRDWLHQLSTQLRVHASLTEGPAVLDWDMLRGLARDGVIIAPHGRRHELLDQVGPGVLHSEVSGSRDDVRCALGTCPPLFSYPNGNVDGRAVRALGDAGYRAAFTTIGGRDALPAPQPLLLRRDQARGSLARLVVKLTPPVAAWRTSRKPLPANAAREGGGTPSC